MSFRVYFNFDDGSCEDLLGQVFDTVEAAEEAAKDGFADYYQGRDYLEEAGEDYSLLEIVDWDIEKE